MPRNSVNIPYSTVQTQLPDLTFYPVCCVIRTLCYTYQHSFYKIIIFYHQSTQCNGMEILTIFMYLHFHCMHFM